MLNAYNNNYVHIYNVGDRKSFGQYIYNHVFCTLQLTNLIFAGSYKYSGCILIVFFLMNEALFICFVQASKCLEAMVYTKHCHKTTISILATFWTLEKDISMKICCRYWLYPNLSICYGIGTHINDLLAQQSIFLICKAFKQHYNYNKWTKRSSFHVNFQWNVAHIKVINIMNNLFHQSFQFVLKSWSLNQMILKCSLVHYAMIMLLIMIF